MDLHLNYNIADGYKSNSQKIRVITENWVKSNLFCVYCGNGYINHFKNNMPAADFYCPHCSEEYELKSKNGLISNKITDGAYGTMINRIDSINNPNFFFMQYNKTDLVVENFIVVPKHFFSAEIIEERKPLGDKAIRKGWIGCNILINQIPEEGKIYIVKQNREQSVQQIINKIQKTRFIANYKLDARGWILDILNCINEIPDKNFTLDQIYKFTEKLSNKHPENHHVKDKIRQQLQILRDKGIIDFNGHGNYTKIDN